MTDRAEVIARIGDRLRAARPAASTLRVGVDGITAAGKTTLADELAAQLRGHGVPVIRLTMDGFHHPRAHRYRQGRDSAAGYYEDAYDFGAFSASVLQPLGPGGGGRYRLRVHDLATDEVLDEPTEVAPAGAVLLVDGSFLQRPELAGGWDEMVFVQTGFELARARGVARDADVFGGIAAAEAAFAARYHAAARRYLDEVDPARTATILLDNDDLSRPVLRRV